MACADSPYIGSICLWPINFAPDGWLFCIGQSLPVNQYQPLFSLIGIQFGGDGTKTFNLPDLRTRVPLGAQYPQTSSYIGQKGGQAQVTLTVSQMPVHTHAASLNSSAQFSGSVALPVQNGFATGGINPANNYLGTSPTTAPIYYNSPAPGATLAPVPISMNADTGAPVTVQAAGGTTPVTIMPPYITLNYIIRVTPGIYPVRP